MSNLSVKQRLASPIFVLIALSLGVVVGTSLLSTFGLSYKSGPVILSVLPQVLPDLIEQLSSRGTHLLVLPPYIVLVVLLISIAVCEFRFRVIPLSVTFPGIVIGVSLAIVAQHITLLNSLAGLLIGAFALWAIKRAYEHSTREPGLGDGVIYLQGMLGAFLGLPYSIATFIAASFSIVIYAMATRLARFESEYYEMGPWLAIFGILFALLQLSSILPPLSDP